MVSALKGNKIEALESNPVQHDSHIPLIDAAIEATVKRFLLSDFGSDDSDNEDPAASPVLEDE